MLPIFLYLDGTWLSEGGGHTITPVSMKIGNLPRHVMNRSDAKRVQNDIYLTNLLYIFVFRVFS